MDTRVCGGTCHQLACANFFLLGLLLPSRFNFGWCWSCLMMDNANFFLLGRLRRQRRRQRPHPATGGATHTHTHTSMAMATALSWGTHTKEETVRCVGLIVPARPVEYGAADSTEEPMDDSSMHVDDSTRLSQNGPFMRHPYKRRNC